MRRSHGDDVPASERPLTPKQQRFVQEYLTDLNATAAADRAGYRQPNQQGPRLLVNVGVAAAIQAARLERSARVEIRADEVLGELRLVGRSSVWDYRIDDRGDVTLAPGVPREAIRAVSSLKKKVRHLSGGRVEYTTEIKLWPKVQAQELLGKHLGLFPDRVAVTFPEGIPVSADDAEAGRRRVEELRRQREGLAHANGDGHAGGRGG